MALDKAKIRRIAHFLSEVYEDICEGEPSPMRLTELCRVIKLLMDAMFEAQDQDLKVLVAGLEHRVRQYKETLGGS